MEKMGTGIDPGMAFIPFSSSIGGTFVQFKNWTNLTSLKLKVIHIFFIFKKSKKLSLI